ncbi:MAG: DUF4376 domain-containing protein [Candidatus Electryoneaceae bacterium]|nr:DUF4376 domain-containing protein [Candidatus Electryoneaceae bacterium]
MDENEVNWSQITTSSGGGYLTLLDLRMPKKSGIFVFNELKKSLKYRDIPIIILTGEGGFLKHLSELREFHEDVESLGDEPTEEVLNRFIDSRPDAFLEKPVEPETLMAAIHNILITRDEVAAEKCQEVNFLRGLKIEGGVIFKGILFDSSNESRWNLTAVAARLSSAKATFQDGFVWRSSDNQDIPMSKEDVLDFHAAMTDWLYNNYKASWEHKAAIDALATIDEIEEYDIKKGWPDNKLSC